jgi:Protein of unknown function (DUF3168)
MLAVGLFALLTADSGFQAAMGTRTDGTTGIFAGQAPEGAPTPLVVYGFAYEENAMTMDGPDVFTTARIEFWVQGSSFLQAKTLARAIRNAFENFQGTLSDGSQVDSIHRISELDTFQDAPFLYLTSQEYQVQYRDLGT